MRRRDFIKHGLVGAATLDAITMVQAAQERSPAEREKQYLCVEAADAVSAYRARQRFDYSGKATSNSAEILPVMVYPPAELAADKELLAHAGYAGLESLALLSRARQCEAPMDTQRLLARIASKVLVDYWPGIEDAVPEITLTYPTLEEVKARERDVPHEEGYWDRIAELTGKPAKTVRHSVSVFLPSNLTAPQLAWAIGSVTALANLALQMFREGMQQAFDKGCAISTQHTPLETYYEGKLWTRQLTFSFKQAGLIW